MVRILGFHCHDLGSVPGRGTEIFPNKAIFLKGWTLASYFRVRV